MNIPCETVHQSSGATAFQMIPPQPRAGAILYCHFIQLEREGNDESVAQCKEPVKQLLGVTKGIEGG